MIRSKIVFHPYFQHLWVRPNFCIPYRWHFLFHSREHVLPIPTWWNPIKWRLVWFVINRKWCKMEVINSNFEQRLLNLHDIIHWSFINFYCEFRKAPSKKLPNHFFPCCHFSRNIRLPPFFSHASRILRVVFHSSLPRNKGTFEAWNFQRASEKSPIARNHWITVGLWYYCCFRNY